MSGAQLLPDPLIVTLYGEPVLVMHGDALCTDDRPISGCAPRCGTPIGSGDSSRCRRARRALAGAARAGSQAHTAAHGTCHHRCQCRTALRWRCARAGTATLLHGHTHRPAIHALEVDGRACTRIVLGDWYDQGSVLRWDRERPRAQSLSRAENRRRGGPNETGTRDRGSVISCASSAANCRDPRRRDRCRAARAAARRARSRYSS